MKRIAPRAGRAPGQRPDSAASGSGGSVTAELALALPAVVLLLAMLLLGASAGIGQVRLETAARAAARAAARGDPADMVSATAHRLAGNGVSIDLTDDGETATVRLTMRLAGPLASLLPSPLTATATARTEHPGNLAVPLAVLPKQPRYLAAAWLP